MVLVVGLQGCAGHCGKKRADSQLPRTSMCGTGFACFSLEVAFVGSQVEPLLSNWSDGVIWTAWMSCVLWLVLQAVVWKLDKWGIS